MRKIQTFSINDSEKLFKGPWDPKDVIKLSNKILRVAKFEGKYGKGFHTHTYDEFFLILDGAIEINTELGKIKLEKLEGAIIPAGIKHQPSASKPTLVLMIDTEEQI